MFKTKSLPNIPKASVSPNFWISQLRILYFLFERHKVLSPRRIKELVSQNRLPLDLNWLVDYLRLGVGLGVFARVGRGLYQRQPNYSFMLKNPQDMTEQEYSLMLELITSIRQCRVILSRVDFLGTIQNAFIMNCIRNPDEVGFDDPSIRSALVLLLHYGFLRKIKQKNSKNRWQVSYVKVVNVPGASYDDPFKTIITQELLEFVLLQSKTGSS